MKASKITLVLSTFLLKNDKKRLKQTFSFKKFMGRRTFEAKKGTFTEKFTPLSHMTKFQLKKPMIA